MRVGIVGLGIMGAPMARNLAKAGYDVVAFNRTPAKTAQLADAGISAAASIAELAAEVDVAITMLPDSPDVEDVALGRDGLFTTLKPGALYIDMSSIRPDVAIRLAAEGASRAIQVLDAPVSGGESAAIDGSLSIMVGGDVDAFERARPILEAMGRTIVRVGSAGAGQTVKAANQLIVAANIAALAEAVVFLEAHGVELPPAIEVLGGGLAGSTVLQRKSANMLNRTFEPGFRLELHHKDLGIVTQAARERGVTTLVASAAAQLVAAGVARGDGGLDHSAMIRIVALLSSS